MQTSIPYTYEFQGNSHLSLVETEDGDIIIAVHRSSERVFEDDYFDVEVTINSSIIELDVHEGGYELSQSEELTMRNMVTQYLKTKQ